MFQESSDNIKVVLRVRPPNQAEIEANSPECVFESEENPDTQFLFGTMEENKTYTFDHVARQNSTQAEIYNHVGKPLANFAVDGYNICLFAYGQTGTGKTFTMYGKLGEEELEGLQTRILKQVFEEISNNDSQETQIITFVHYFEIYNEQILDLLGESIVDDKKQIQIREDVKKGIYIENLSCKYIHDYQSAMHLLNKGNKQRHIAETKMNMESSRSHSIFQFHIQQKTVKNGITNFKDSKINFVDLAGSERQKSTHATGERLKEATNINKSLSILGRVINQLVEKTNHKKKTLHIPYRDSKLTFLLKDSLGGNAKTVMIATITASDLAYQETLSTLKFAQRAKMIQNKAEKNEESSGSLQLLQKEIKLLRKQLEKYKIQVDNFEAREQEYQNSSQQLNTEQSEADQYLTTQENEAINEIPQQGDIDLVQEIQKLKDMLAIKEHELNIEQIKYSELEFDFNHQLQKNKILEEQLEEMKGMLKQQNDHLANSKTVEKQNKTEQEVEHQQISDNMLQVSEDQNDFQHMISSTIGNQELQNIQAENEFLKKKLEKFYKIQGKFLNSSQLKVMDENKSQINQDDPFLEIMNVNEQLDSKVQSLIQDNNEIKNENQKLLEDNDTLRQTIFYISSQLNQARQEQSANGNFNKAFQSRKTFSLSNKHNFNPSSASKNSNSRSQSRNVSNIRDYSTCNQYNNDSFQDILSGLHDPTDEDLKQTQQFFQYYNNYKYQLLFQSNKEIQTFYQDKNAVMHNNFTIYIFMVWQNSDNVDLFLKNFKFLTQKIQKQSGLIINLMGNGLDDEQFEHVVQNGFRQLVSLQELNLNISHNEISDLGLQSLTDTLKFMPHLQKLTLNIEKNKGITIDSISNLLQQLKQLNNLKQIQIDHDEIEANYEDYQNTLQKIGQLTKFSSFKIDLNSLPYKKPTIAQSQIEQNATRGREISFNVQNSTTTGTKKKNNKKSKKNIDDLEHETTCKVCSIF